MKFESKNSNELDWRLDFHPRSRWPAFLPVICVENETLPLVVTGFDRKEDEQVSVLVVKETLDEVVKALWPEDRLGAFEMLRLAQKLNHTIIHSELLNWPLDLQNYCDEKKLALKSLEPLVHLQPFKESLTVQILRLNPSASQLREILDLVCDLKLADRSWDVIADQGQELTSWLKHLKQLRFPLTTSRDLQQAYKVQKVAWPKGIQARWERQGDLAGIHVQFRLTQTKDWNRIQADLPKIQLGEDFWKTEI